MSDKNYITPGGFKTLQDELRQLRKDERPKLCEVIAWAAGNGDRSENGDYIYGKKRLREIDKRIRFLMKALDACQVIDPETVKADDVRFGATVTILDEDDNEKVYSIVGRDETNIEKGYISWRSPVALALQKKREGDFVTIRTPGGEQEVEIVKIEYKTLS